MIRPMQSMLRRHQRTMSATAPYPAAKPRSIYDGDAPPWPVEPDQMVHIIGRHGWPTECSPVRCVQSGETVQLYVGESIVRGVLQ